MTVKKEDYEKILDSLQLGNPIAEYDNILQEARVDTPVFQGVMNDKYDLVTGRKGAGKTAIFKIIGDLLGDFFLDKYKRVILTGVNSRGEPIFNQFKDDFEKYTEEDFENFWKIYFILLIYNDFIKNAKFSEILKNCNNEVQLFKDACAAAGIPNIPARSSRKQLIEGVVVILKNIKGVKSHIGVTPNLSLFGASIELEMKDKFDSTRANKNALYIHDIGLALTKILEKCGYTIWIVLDRLDEVFERYSMEEFNGLRGLLKAYRSFDLGNKGTIKVKIFLRDDIKLFLLDAGIFLKNFGKTIPTFPAATHIFAKESPVLNWTRDEIEKLILYRLSLSEELRLNIGMTASNREDIEQELRTKQTRLKYWNKIFPEKIVTSTSLDWIYTRLADSNGVVTPRSVIDMLNGAVEYLKQNLQTNFEDSAYIFPEEAIKQGHAIASKSKLENDIYNEFPKDQENIKKLANGRGKLTTKELRKLFGKDWKNEVENLRRIGILRLVKNSNDYMVVFLFRPALGITYKY